MELYTYFFSDVEEQDRSGGFYHCLQGKWDQLSVYWDITSRPRNINTGKAQAEANPVALCWGCTIHLALDLVQKYRAKPIAEFITV